MWDDPEMEATHRALSSTDLSAIDERERERERDWHS
jgi:hypothetical protein